MTVVDASVWVSVFTDTETHHPVSRSWLEEQLISGQTLVIPSLALVEVSGAIARRTGRPQRGLQALDSLLQAPGLRSIELDLDLGLTAAQLATQLQLRGADAVYVAVAHALDLPLVTWDQELLVRAAPLIAVAQP